jgi:hypothetical protein
VDALGAEVKGLDGRDHQAGEQGGAVGLIELIQGAGESIVAQALGRAWAVTQSPEVQRIHPFGQLI